MNLEKKTKKRIINLDVFRTEVKDEIRVKTIENGFSEVSACKLSSSCAAKVRNHRLSHSSRCQFAFTVCLCVNHPPSLHAEDT